MAGKFKICEMDMQSLLCGLAAESLRPSLPRGLRRNMSLPQLELPRMPRVGLKRLRSLRERPSRGRRHLPPGSGPYTVGCVDIMSDHSVTGIFLRLYYPTNTTDVFVSIQEILAFCID